MWVDLERRQQFIFTGETSIEQSGTIHHRAILQVPSKAKTNGWAMPQMRKNPLAAKTIM
jgi:hypothetical protein